MNSWVERKRWGGERSWREVGGRKEQGAGGKVAMKQDATEADVYNHSTFFLAPCYRRRRVRVACGTAWLALASLLVFMRFSA